MILSLEYDQWRYHQLYILRQHIDLWHYPILFCKITVLLAQESILCCTHGDLGCTFQLLFPYCTCVVKISAQKLCVTIKSWLLVSCECFLSLIYYLWEIRECFLLHQFPVIWYTLNLWPGLWKSTMWAQITPSCVFVNIFSSECSFLFLQIAKESSLNSVVVEKSLVCWV